MPNDLLVKQVGLVLFNTVFSIIVPLITNYFNWTTGFESVVLGVLVSVLLLSIESLHFLTVIEDKKEQEQRLWQVKNSFDMKLANLREAYSKILSNRRDIPDLFQSFIDERVTELEKMMLETGNHDELHLEKSHVISVDVLLGCFKGESEHIIRAVHFIEDNDFFFDIYAKHYFYKTFKLVQSGKIKEVHRILIYEDEQQLKDPRTIRLVAFHSTANGYSYRMMRKKDFYSMLNDHRLTVPRDFGIYGDKYVYVAQVNLESNMVGYWIRNASDVAMFIRFFDSCWGSPISTPPKQFAKAIDPIGIEELYIES